MMWAFRCREGIKAWDFGLAFQVHAVQDDRHSQHAFFLMRSCHGSSVGPYSGVGFEQRLPVLNLKDVYATYCIPYSSPSRAQR